MHNILLCIFLSLLTACATTHESRVSRGKLSDAMSKASDGYQGERVVSAPPSATASVSATTDTSRLTSSDVVSAMALSSASSENKSPDPGTLYGFFSGGGVAGNSALGASRHIGAMLGKQDENILFYLYASAERVDISPRASLATSLRDGLTVLSIGGALRGYRKDDLSWYRPYFSVGLGKMEMAWTYRNAIRSTADSSSMESDSVSGMEMFISGGVAFVFNKHLRAELEAMPLLRVAAGPTANGYDNDVFWGMNAIHWSANIAYQF